MQVPEFRVAYSIKTDALDALYRKLKPKGVTMSGLLVKAAAAALVKHPDLYAGELLLFHIVTGSPYRKWDPVLPAVLCGFAPSVFCLLDPCIRRR